MAKNSIRDYSATSSLNTDVQSVDISEGCAASGINNAIREVMADLKDVSSGTVALESPQADSLTVTGDLTVDTNTLHVDAANNRLGVGTVSPSQEMHLYAGSGATDLLIEQGTTGNAYLHTKNSNREYAIGTASDQLKFIDLTADAVRMSILSGGGLTFNGDTAAANALSDFETGNWTYTASSNITLTSSTGKYTKVGDLVTAIASIAGVAFTSGNECIIGGLPFAPAVGNTPVLVVINNGGTFGYTPRARIDTASTVKFRAPATDNNLNVMVQAIYQV